MTRFIDKAMDWMVLPGYSSIGYRVRKRLMPHKPISVSGRSIMVTGASSGIGEAACSELGRLGARVLVIARSRERGEQALDRIVKASGSSDVELHLCDVSSLASVREFAAEFVVSHASLDVLVNNADVRYRPYATSGRSDDRAAGKLGRLVRAAPAERHHPSPPRSRPTS